MKDKKAVLYGKAIRCPCCGYELQIGATVRLKCAREIGQLQLSEPEEAPGIKDEGD